MDSEEKKSKRPRIGESRAASATPDFMHESRNHYIPSAGQSGQNSDGGASSSDDSSRSFNHDNYSSNRPYQSRPQQRPQGGYQQRPFQNRFQNTDNGGYQQRRPYMNRQAEGTNAQQSFDGDAESTFTTEGGHQGGYNNNRQGG